MRTCPQCDTTMPDGVAAACARCGFKPAIRDGFAAYAPELADTTEGFDPALFPELARLEAGNFWFRIRNKLIRRYVHRHFLDAQRVLEVGCGTGFVLSTLAEALPQASIHGSELHPSALSFASSRVPRATLLQMDARRIPFREEFDLIGAFDVIEHIEADELVLAQMHKALRPGGGILLTVPQHQLLWSQQDVIASHVRRYEPHELEEKVSRAGFRVVDSTSFVSLLLPVLFLSRRGKREQQAHFDPTSEFRLSPLMNAALYAVLNIEYAAIVAGVRFPFGGSRLVAASKE